MSRQSHAGGKKTDFRYIDDLEATVKAPGFKHADFWERGSAFDLGRERTDDRL